MIEDVKVIDDGEYGARLEAPEGQKPNGVCPGLGGWKRFESGWFTRVKGEQAARILAQIDPQFPYGSIDDHGNFQHY
jgi:hypothetical protein